MRTKWFALALAAAVAVGCGPSEEQKKAEQSQARQTEWAAIEADWKALEAKRAEAATLAAQAAADPAVQPQAAAASADAGKLHEAVSGRLAAFINADPPVVGEPMRPDQVAAIRLNSALGMLVAREYIDDGGDYRRAVDIYNQLLSADPDNPDVKAALADAQAKRFMTAERFALVTKKMSEAEVIAAIGRPIARNVKNYPEKNVTAWFYPKDEQGNAAGVFFHTDKKTVYETKFDAVKTATPGEEAEGGA
jgi:tetratricopeptide (TPR) repeat protein